MLDRDLTYISWVAGSGEVLPLSGYRRDGTAGVWLGGEPKNIGRVEAKQIFEASARQRGERWVANTYDHGEIELPLFILDDTAAGIRQRREHLKRLMHPETAGYLTAATSTTGIRWIRARRTELAPIFTKDTDLGVGLRLDVVLAADDPQAATPPHTSKWRNVDGAETAAGTLWSDPGPDTDDWPELTFIGPGRPVIRYADVEFDLGETVLPGETVLIVTDQARPTVRAHNPATGQRRDLLAPLRGRKFSAPVPRGQVTRVDLTVTGAGPTTQALLTTAQSWEGLI